MPGRTVEEDERIVALLSERGINGLAELMGYLDDMTAETFLNTIKWWDDLPGTKGTGLLVSKLREGGIRGYKRAHERTGVDGEVVVGPKQLAVLRGICLTPDGIDRETAREMCAKLAAKANTTPDDLIDSVVGPEWQETPAHPAKLSIWGEVEEGQIRYEVWLHRRYNEDRVDDPRPATLRKGEESDLSFSKRFWGWKDPDNLKERADKRREARQGLQMTVPMSLPAPKPVPALVGATPVGVEATAIEAPPTDELDERWGSEAPWDEEDLDLGHEEEPEMTIDEQLADGDPW